LYGAGSEGIAKQNLAIQTQEEWNNLITAMNSVNNVSNNFTETDIDFSKYQVLAIFDEVKGSGGWSIDITGVTEYQDEIIVTVENLQKGGTATVMTQPYYIVKIPKSDKKIIFDDKTMINNVLLNSTFWASVDNLPMGNLEFDRVYVINTVDELEQHPYFFQPGVDIPNLTTQSILVNYFSGCVFCDVKSAFSAENDYNWEIVYYIAPVACFRPVSFIAYMFVGKIPGNSTVTLNTTAANCTNEHQSNCNQNVIISADEYENAPNHLVHILDMKIEGDCLKIKFGTSGCSGNNWIVKLIDSEVIAKSLPLQRILRLSLNDIGLCAAAFSREVSFNIKGLQVQGYSSVLLNISGERILYEYEREETTPFSETEMTNSVNNFSMNFFATAYEELSADENIVLSPLSLNMALAMVWNGAIGNPE
jgi:hypothetical protein